MPSKLPGAIDTFGVHQTCKQHAVGEGHLLLFPNFSLYGSSGGKNLNYFVH